MRITHRHQSFLHAAKDRAINAALSEHYTHCTVLSGTEGAGPRWRVLLSEPGWERQQENGDFNRGDVWVAWESSVWHPVEGGVEQLSAVTYDDRRCHAAWQVLDHWNGKGRLAAISTHLPAHVADDLRDGRRTERTRAYKESLSSLTELVKVTRAAHKGVRVVVAADWNLDWQSDWTREFIARHMRGTSLRPARGIDRQPGTFNGRLIDWALTDMDSSGEVLKPIDASDHRGVAFIHED